MVSHSRPHGHGKGKDQRSHSREPLMGLHKDWRTWIVIGVMLAAISTYVLTLDDSVQPGGTPPGASPTATAPANPSQ